MAEKVMTEKVITEKVITEKAIIDDLLTEYLQSLTSDQHKIIEIAKKQLGTSYDLKKSIGFVQFIKKNGL
jgi:hypothetical protein